MIDIAPFHSGDPAQHRGVVAAVAKACEQTGFFVITGHGVSDAAARAIYARGREFFERPTEEKMRIERPGPASAAATTASRIKASERHWASPRRRTCRRASPSDRSTLAGVPIGNRNSARSTSIPTFGRRECPNSARRSSTITGRWSSVGVAGAHLRAGATARRELLRRHNRQACQHHAARTLDPRQLKPPVPGWICAGAHSDYGAFTILKTEDAPGGLQVVQRSRAWIDVPFIDGAFVINIGDLFRAGPTTAGSRPSIASSTRRKRTSNARGNRWRSS